MEKIIARISDTVAISLLKYGNPPVAIPNKIAIEMAKEKLEMNFGMYKIQIGLFIFLHMIKNFEELAENTIKKFINARRDALEIMDYVLEEMNGYNLIKKRVKIFKKAIFIDGRKFNLSCKKIFLTGFGKASASMAKAMEEIIEFDEGYVISTEEINLRKAKLLKGTHPFPSEENIKATEKIIEIFERADENDLIFVLISGGGSSLLCRPSISLKSMIEMTKELMEKGCTIEELNTVRKHISDVKGGKLAKKTKAKIISLIISDIIGNPVEFISSGPTSPDTTTFHDAMNILKKYGIKNKEVVQHIKKGIKGKIDETPEKIDNVENVIIADNEMACKKAKKKAEEKGYYSRVVSTKVRGEAVNAGRDLAIYAKIYPRNRSVLIFGGETTVKVKGKGNGGRNQELVLSSIKEISDENIVIISCGTDGIDGSSLAAGAIADGYSYEKASEKGLNIEEYLRENNSYEFFKKMGDAIITGYTGTNVMDLQIIVKL